MLTTTSLPVAAFTATKMDDETGLSVTKDHWEEQGKKWSTRRLGGAMFTPELMTNITTELHPGCAALITKKRNSRQASQ